MNALGLNIFGGGFTLGVQRVFNVIGQWEECDAHKKTFDINTKYFQNVPRVLRYSDWPIETMKADFIYANPPCAPWSVAARYASKKTDDPRLEMTAHSMQTALRLKPKVFVCESVTNAFTQGRDYYDQWAAEWIARGYGVTYWLTDALLHGVPSTRQRFHFIASRYALELEQPAMNQFMPVTVRMAIGDIQTKLGQLSQHSNDRAVTADSRRIMLATPPGCSVYPTRKSIGLPDSRRFGFITRRLIWDAPGHTIVDFSEVVHPGGERYITVREGLRLCGYPDDFNISVMKAATQAVMPRMGETLAQMARKAIEDRRPVRQWIQTVDWRHLAEPYRPGAVRAAMDELL